MAIYPKTNKTMLEKVLSGDEVSWQEFYRHYTPVILSLCRFAGLPAECRDDVVQEVMSRFARNSSSYLYMPERAHFRTYFNKIVRGAISDQYRKMEKQDRIRKNLCDDEQSASPEWEEAGLKAWRNAVLEDALHELSMHVSSKKYLAFTMSTFQNHSIRETAEFLGLSAAQVYQARFRCEKALKKIICRCNDADPDLNLSILEK